MQYLFFMVLAMVLVAVMAIPLILINTIRVMVRGESIREYFMTVAIGFDQAGGSILYQQEDWTVSSWTYWLSINGNKYADRFMWGIDLIFGSNHCKNSFEWEVARQGMPR